MTPNFEYVPDYLKHRLQWLLWRYENINRKKPTKVPYQPDGRRAKTNDSTTWSSFDKCLQVLEQGKFDGIGFVFAEGDGLVGIDLDHCFSPDGQLEPWAKDVVIHFTETYIERSPSNDGLHIWCHGKPVKTGSKKWPKSGTDLEEGLEVYDYHSPRYLTVTGNIFNNEVICHE